MLAIIIYIAVTHATLIDISQAVCHTGAVHTVRHPITIRVCIADATATDACCGLVRIIRTAITTIGQRVSIRIRSIIKPWTNIDVTANPIQVYIVFWILGAIVTIVAKAVTIRIRAIRIADRVGLTFTLTGHILLRSG